ncbi:DEP domain-containing protein 1B isoform X1 [Octopus bimaculoides]|uniref:DEP domain-containing protein n=1 Tax=Octopus bimaculoides TaxID=37653 RepID=A0A0L8H9N9_OCTBM|nr:DEP domain-containing protein 1B isoform X1 [Octopus bimaculoides]|eukprot:XP_014774234.1 PREDICTED: DEP domain-containing protein 1B-like isoform X1 [Octopus bimaculoides]
MNSNIVANEDDDFSGPYRATKIWNTIIRAFKQGMPIGRRRRYMKVYDKAFTATEALEWMHKYLKSNPNFGSDITKQQTVQLMSKLLKARIFEDVQGSKKKREFAEGGRVYRFNQSSPAKDSRVPLSARMDLMNAAPGQKTVLSKSEKSKTTSKFKSLAIPKCHLVAKPLSLESMEAVWRMVTLHRLQKTIGYNTLEEFLDASLVNGRHIMHNCLYVNKSGVVGNVNTKDQLPHWILSAMKCLVHWPNKVDDNFAIYPGFEKDVFRAVSEYFQGLTEPLLTHSLYETITNVFVMADSRYARHSSPLSAKYNAHSMTSFDSIDNLLLNMTNAADNSQKSHLSNKSGCQRALFSTWSSSSFPHLRGHSLGGGNLSENKIKSESTGSIPLLRYETAFGPENKTITNVYYYPNQTSATFSGSMFSRLPSVSNLEYQNGFQTISSSPSRWQSEQHLKCVDKQTLNILDTFKNKDILSNKPQNKSSLSRKSKSQNISSQKTKDGENQEKSNSLNEIRYQTRAFQASSLTQSAAYHEEEFQDRLHSTRPYSTSNIPNLSPVEGLDKFGRKINNAFSSAVWSMTDEERVKQAVQLALLLIPPSNRRKLHLLLRFLSKIHKNNELQLAQNSEDLRNLIVDTFYQSVLCSPDASDMDTNLAKHFLWYLVENHDFVMQVPCDLRKQVEERLSEIQRVQVVYSSDDKGSTTYCKQIPLSAYEKESLHHSTEALRDLLKKIIADEKMNFKEKRKRLSEFQKLYPKIYENELGFRNPIPAAPPLKIQRNIHLPRPLRRLRTLRS